MCSVGLILLIVSCLVEKSCTVILKTSDNAVSVKSRNLTKEEFLMDYFREQWKGFMRDVDEIDTDVEKTESRKKKQQDLMSRILPMLVIPFLMQALITPLVLTSLKIMLLKSMFVGKIAVILALLNMLRRSSNQGGVYSHNINIPEQHEKLFDSHYGYKGDEEYGAYVNR